MIANQKAVLSIYPQTDNQVCLKSLFNVKTLLKKRSLKVVPSIFKQMRRLEEQTADHTNSG